MTDDSLPEFDHRRIGQTQDLFHFQEEAKGMVFWHPKGWAMYLALEAYIRSKLNRRGYREVKAPQIMDRTLWERSGHWEKFGKNMFVCETEEGEELAIKPMNCPGHVQIFNQGQKSYRDLPLRLSEFGSCHRYEPSGAILGLMRVRAFTQDDAHIFCRESQIEDETKAFIELIQEVYGEFGLNLHDIKFSTRPEVRAGDDDLWDKAEAALRSASEASGIEMVENPGEGAFYGPKLEFSLSDQKGRVWQCGTIQLDFVLPGRLDASYVNEAGEREVPVMLHRAILGSFERFIGILLEHYEGKMPAWLAPTQVVIATITDAADDHASWLVEHLKDHNIRAECDLRNEKIGFKVREHFEQKVPLVLAVGKRDVENNSCEARFLGEKETVTWDLVEMIRRVRHMVEFPGAPDRIETW